MALYIFYNTTQDTPIAKRQFEWHVGESIPDQVTKDSPRVVTFQADGDELDLINRALGYSSLLEPLEVLVLPVQQSPSGDVIGYELQMKLAGLIWSHHHNEPAKDVDLTIQRGVRTVGYMRQALYDHYKVVAVDARVKEKVEEAEKLRAQLAVLEAEIEQATQFTNSTEPKTRLGYD